MLSHGPEPCASTNSATSAYNIRILLHLIPVVNNLAYATQILSVYPFDMYLLLGYNQCMIKSFADKETEKIYNQVYSKKLPSDIQRIALRKLIMINNAYCLNDLKVPPSNHLEKLSGNRKGQYSIRINDQFRICFTEKDNNFYNVEITDYH